MSRIGKKPIPVPPNVEIKIKQGKVELKGPKGEMVQSFPNVIKVEYDKEKKVIRVNRPDDSKKSKAFQGLTRALIANAVKGVTEGFSKSLEIIGTGYNAKLKGKQLELNVGYCIPQVLDIPKGITVELPNPTKIVLKGCDKQLVGQFAANIRAVRPPDAYKGKGIRYEGEVIKLKPGKSFASAS